MRDLEFWRSLRHRKIDDVDLSAKLREVARWPVQERLPFLGFMPPLFRHADAAVRAAALGCLAGCVGPSAYEHLVAALQDAEASVRVAAVEALRDSLFGGDGSRWAHVLFHPRPEVRQAGLQAGRHFPPADWWAIYLLPDPVCAEAARQKLKDVVLPVETLPVLIDYACRGIITRAEARRWACQSPSAAVIDFFSRWGQRGQETCTAMTACLAIPDGRKRLLVQAGFDPLDDLCELLADAAEAEPLRWLAVMQRESLGWSEEQRRRVLASLLVTLARLPESAGISPLAKLAVVLDSRLLACPWLALSLRRGALQGFYDLGQQTPSVEAELGFSFLQADICRRADGLLDLWAVGAVLHLFARDPYQQLLSRYSIAEVSAAFEADPVGAVPFFGLSDRSPQGRKFLLRELCLRPRPERSRLLAQLCEVLPLDGLEFIDLLEAGVACEVASKLIERDTELAEKRIARLRRLLADKIVAGHVGPFLNAWLSQVQPQDNPLGLAILGELSGRAETHLLEQAVASFSVPMLRKFLTAANCCNGFSYDREIAMARLLSTHGDEFIRVWAAARLQPWGPARRELDAAEKSGILRAGLCQSLRAQPDPEAPDVAVCSSLLACHDLPDEVDAQFARFSSLDPVFVSRLDEEMVLNWRGEKRLPLIGHVWLFRWDAHLLAFDAHLVENELSLPALLESADAFAAPLLRRRLWEAVARLLEYWRWWSTGTRQERLGSVWTEPMLAVLVKHLTSDLGEAAARLLLQWWKAVPADPLLAAGRLTIVGSLTAASEEVRQTLSPWIDTRGLEATNDSHRPVVEATAPADDRRVPAEARYRRAAAMFERGEAGASESLIAALLESGPTGWFTATDWRWLFANAARLGGEMSLFLQLVESPHPHAYEPAVMGLTQSEEYTNVEIQRALTAFLECGTARMRELRLQAAQWLYKTGAWQPALPILLQGEPTDPPLYPDLLANQPYDVVVAVVRGILLLQRNEADEKLILDLLLADGVNDYAREEGLALLLPQAFNPDVRKRARENLRPRHSREMKLRRVADTFAWGVRVGRELTGKLFSIEMIASEKLGYTRFIENKIYITPLPILRGEMHGRQVVRALILHEYGHHMYHRGDEAQAIWKQSDTEGLQRLLNLVSDEHLERNLRALDRRFGDQLKMLAAYAFQHTARELAVVDLLNVLQGRAFEVLSAAPLNVARRHGCVSVQNGRLLMLMEKAGLSFARFVRALRMGLGNRHDDPRVEAGLALFRGRFRKSNMPRLYEIAKKLREIFGAETDILNSFDQDAIWEDAGDWDDVSEGITNEEVQTEVQSSLQGKNRGRKGEGNKGGRGLNLGPDEQFDLITQVQPMPYDQAQHAVYARQVARPAQVLRSYLKKLGIGFNQQRFRLSGRSFDRTRAKVVVLRGDPRMLIARELKVQTDLFIGVVVDCSGSMSHNANIEKAKLFGTLIAEAGRNYPGVDVRLFGFTDQVIYDAGHANRCAIHALEAGGGNNDSAGLWHAALAAKASRRRAKLLVMISDGAPTECTVSSLTALVTRLTKRLKMCCAQVGVCPLDHQCFPNYILLDSDNVEASVRQFGNVMGRLVQQALRGG